MKNYNELSLGTFAENLCRRAHRRQQFTPFSRFDKAEAGTFFGETGFSSELKHYFMGNISAKAALRTIVKSSLRENTPHRMSKSSMIWDRLSGLAEFQAVKNDGHVMIYLDFEDEVRTTRFLPAFFGISQITPKPFSDKLLHLAEEIMEKKLSDETFRVPFPSVVIPYCSGEEIVPFLLRSLDELESGYGGIKEPKEIFRASCDRKSDLGQIDLVIVPGLAFDRKGNRLGRGKGYYDRFLRRVSSKTLKIALAFECQIFEAIPHGPDDVPMDLIVTEDRVIRKTSSPTI